MNFRTSSSAATRDNFRNFQFLRFFVNIAQRCISAMTFCEIPSAVYVGHCAVHRVASDILLETLEYVCCMFCITRVPLPISTFDVHELHFLIELQFCASGY